MLNPFSSLTWKLGTFAAGIIALILSGALILSKIETHGLRTERNTLFSQIHDEETGYVVRLTTAQRNATILQLSISDQNERISRLEAEGAARVANSKREIEEARADAAGAQSALDAVLNRPIEGESRCDRVEDVDLRILEALRQ